MSFERFVPRQHETAHQTAARLLLAHEAGRSPVRWRVVANLAPLRWYDWADPATGKVGQCYLKTDGTWLQDPRGVQPVVLGLVEALGRERG